MSYYEDYEERYAYFEDSGYNEPYIPNIDYDFWTLKDGAQVHIADMSKNHLANTIRMLEHSDNPYAEGYIRVMRAELKSRSPAQDAINDFAE